MTEKRYGRQTPTQSFILPYEKTSGKEAIDLYESTGRKAQEWQILLTYDILSQNDDGLWVHTKFGDSIPRRNGKGEILTIRELYGIVELGENILHTAHLTSTSSAASKRLARLLKDAGYEEVIRVQKDVKYEKAFSYSKQFGLERITILSEKGGTCYFRTRTSNGGLGEGFDLWVADEAQELTLDQENTLKYTVSDSKNPQTIYCGTPPTAVSKGTEFPKYRKRCLQGKEKHGGWAEWSVDSQSDIHDVELWYQCNPAMGYQLDERKVEDELGDDVVDFNIQRLGWWPTFSQKSEISSNDWERLKVKRKPRFKDQLYVGIKFGKSSGNTAFSIACRTKDERVYVECIDCREIRQGNDWIIRFLKSADIARIVIDGQNGQAILKDELDDHRIKNYTFPKVSEVIEAFATFEQGIYNESIAHGGQPSVVNVVTNVDKRAIGSNGGFGYKCIKDGCDISILDSIALAYWACAKDKKKTRTKQKISY